MAESDWVDVGSEDDWVDVGPPKAAPSSWSWGGAASNFGSGAVEGITGGISLLADLNPLTMGMPNPYQAPGVIGRALGEEAQPGQYSAFPWSHAFKAGTDSILPAPDPQHRYARTLGQFTGPGLLGGIASLAGAAEAVPALEILTSQATPTALASAGSGALGAQGAQDMFKDTAVAPLFGALLAGSLPSVALNGYQGLKTLLTPATEDEVLGSAAKAFKEQTQLTPKEISWAMATRPQDALGDAMTTAEITGNAGVAQLEKSLAGSGVPGMADTYNARGAVREKTRNSMLSEMSQVPAVNAEELGQNLVKKAGAVQQQMDETAKTLWDNVPRHVEIDATPEQLELSGIIKARQGGLPLGGRVKKLVDQFLQPGEGGLTTGAAQDIRSDALMLLRDANTTPFEARTLTTLQKGIDSAMERELGGAEGWSSAYADWKAAREATRKKAETFAKGTVGGSLTNPQLDSANALDKAFTGTTRSHKEMLAALDSDPALLEDVKRGVLDSVPRDNAGNLTPAKMNKFVSANEQGLRALFGDEHYGRMQRIVADLNSEAGVRDLATRASKGGSATAQNMTVAGAINDMAVGALLPKTGILGKLSVALQGIFGARNDTAVKELLFNAAMDPSFALELSLAPTTTRIFNTGERLVKAIKDGAFYGGVSATLEGARTQEKLTSPAPRQASVASAATASPRQSLQGSATEGAPLAPAGQRLNTSSANSPTFWGKAQDGLAALASALSPATANASEPPALDGIDDLSRALEKVESGGRADAVSPKGAIGTHQVMPIAARDVLRSQGVDDSQFTDAELTAILKRPGMSKLFGEAYLALMLKRFGGNRELALAAYNGGPSRLDSVGRNIAAMPEETRNYVPSVLANL